MLVFVQSALLALRIIIALVDVLEPQTQTNAHPALILAGIICILPVDAWEQFPLSAQSAVLAALGNIRAVDVLDQLTPFVQTALLVALVNINVLTALLKRTDYAKVAFRPHNVLQMIKMREYMASVVAPVDFPRRLACRLVRLYVKFAHMKQICQTEMAVLKSGVMESHLIRPFGAM